MLCPALRDAGIIGEADTFTLPVTPMKWNVTIAVDKVEFKSFWVTIRLTESSSWVDEHDNSDITNLKNLLANTLYGKES